MIVSDRRSELGYTVEDLYRISGVPRFRLLRLEAGVESLRCIPFEQCCSLALALEVPFHLWYHYVMSEDYSRFLKGRLNNG